MSQQLFEPGTKVRFTGPQLVEFVQKHRSNNPYACIEMLTQYVTAVQPVIRPWIPIEFAQPQEGQHVIVAGGVAQYRGGEFYTGMEEPLFQRPIEWPVKVWMPLPDSPRGP